MSQLYPVDDNSIGVDDVMVIVAMAVMVLPNIAIFVITLTH